jgi:hypothetical protein
MMRASLVDIFLALRGFWWEENRLSPFKVSKPKEREYNKKSLISNKYFNSGLQLGRPESYPFN